MNRAVLRQSQRKAFHLPLCILAILIPWPWCAGGAVAETFFVGPLGNDANDCLSPAGACATFQHVVDLCPVTVECLVHAANGTYSQFTNVAHFKHVLLSGPRDEREACIDRGAVNVMNQPEHRPIFLVQDHATLRIACMRLEARDTGNCGFRSRQFAIGDLDDVDFGVFPAGCAVSAEETSKINISNPGIYGNASRFAFATDLSQVTIGGFVRIADVITFDVAFLASTTNSVVSFYPSGMEGAAHFAGASYQCVDASLNKGVVLPGGDVPYSASDDCAIRGPGASSKGLGAEINALRSKVNDIQHAAILLVLVVVAGAAGAAYYCRPLKK